MSSVNLPTPQDPASDSMDPMDPSSILYDPKLLLGKDKNVADADVIKAPVSSKQSDPSQSSATVGAVPPAPIPAEEVKSHARKTRHLNSIDKLL